MRPRGSGNKKLIVAFHFQYSNPAGWKCDSCRKSGLEMARRCGWIPAALETPETVVWARGRVSVTVCPTWYVTAESLRWLEEFHAWRKLGRGSVERLGARQAEAFLILEREISAEEMRGGD
jgi:hypothetical protein